MDDVKQWSDMDQKTRTRIVVLGVVEAILTLISLVDLARRPDSEIRGPKKAWVPTVFVQPFGPLLYLLWGRRGGQ